MKIMITGGLGFIGVNASRYFAENNEVHIVDNLSRNGTIQNFNLLKKIPSIKFHFTDIRNFFDLENLFKKIKPDVVLHLAAQVAVTQSVKNAREDFDINVNGTFNVLECIRLHSPNSIILYSSTNKVYGDYQNDLIELPKRYSYSNGLKGISENMQLDFHSPYGCSKGSADQYVRDYSRIYGVKSVVLRQSCIYGEHQFGIEDQGWVAWFTIASMFNKKFFVYGDGKQVRDVLFVDDLVLLYQKIIENIDKCKGEVFNVGGGEKNTLSLIELIENLNDKNLTTDYEHGSWRPGDQKIYISDIDKLQKTIGWKPIIDVTSGLERLNIWVKHNKNTFIDLGLV